MPEIISGICSAVWCLFRVDIAGSIPQRRRLCKQYYRRPAGQLSGLLT
ncbi:MAG: hypothetical protein ACI4OX_02440 [Akkermansia sp.]